MRIPFVLLVFCMIRCASGTGSDEKARVIFDTDTNNELDDQHALAYLLFNGQTFDVAGVTINATRGGGNIDEQYAEAERVTRLCGFKSFPVFKGADGNFDSIKGHLSSPTFDGADAVNFILEQSRSGGPRLTVIAVGKLTNLALALAKDPGLQNRIRIVWLGSNYPDPGEYNLDNDTASVNYVLKTGVEFEFVTVRYGQPGGSDVVRLTKNDALSRMPGLGPTISTPVIGRHGGEFRNFGDYSVSLFENIQYSGNPPSRALYDMVAVAIVKNPAWGTAQEILRPLLINNRWVEGAASGKVKVWGNFEKDRILSDFFAVMAHPIPVELKQP